MRYPNAPIAAVSRSQVARVLQQGRENIRVIYHGCDFDLLKPSFAAGKYLAFIGRMNPQKNPLGAIQVAAKAGLPIVLAGKPQTASEEVYSMSKSSRFSMDESDLPRRGESGRKIRLSGQCQRTASTHRMGGTFWAGND